MRTVLIVVFSALVVSKGHGQGRLSIAEGAKSTVFMGDSAATPNEESTPTFAPDGKTVYIANNGVICFAKRVAGRGSGASVAGLGPNDHWTKPKPVSFTGQYKDWDPTLTPDGERLLFVSNRPYRAMDGSTKTGNHLWMSRLLAEGKWSEPEHLDSPVNESGLVNYGPSISASGTICFCSRDRDGNKGMHAYLCRRAGDHYDKPQLLLLNGNEPTYDPYIAPDERYILFSSDSALFISYRTGRGWSRGEKLGPQVNDASKSGMLWGPSISRDGKTLFFNGGTVDGIEMIPVSWGSGRRK
ncbi:MAG: PD40 domain-containing protein [Bacteroidetes bacterium]|nr:PD40 domain-containing protein [Bacteroidota bacterium]